MTSKKIGCEGDYNGCKFFDNEIKEISIIIYLMCVLRRGLFIIMEISIFKIVIVLLFIWLRLSTKMFTVQQSVKELGMCLSRK